MASKSKILYTTGFSLALLLSLSACTGTTTPEPKETVTANMGELSESTLTPIDEDVEFSWALNTGTLFPVKTLPYQETYHRNSNEADLAHLSQKYADLGLDAALEGLPSEADGYTSDITKTLNEDGSLNKNYAYWTKESFLESASVVLERLLNPLYGSWSTYQYSAAAPAAAEDLEAIFADVILPETLKAAEGEEAVPVFADWDANDYGLNEKLLESGIGNRWIGTVTSLKAVPDYEKNDDGEYEVKVTADITYSAWAQDGTELTKQGTLELILTPNRDNTAPTNPEQKVAVKSSKMEIKP